MGYKILRWDSIEQNNKIVPMIYFKPCLKFMNIMKLNDNKILLKISGTEMYNGIYNGVANKSSIVPNCRPNFFDATNLYVIILNASFYQYPNLDKMGYFEISNFNNKPIQKPTPKPTPKPSGKPSPSRKLFPTNDYVKPSAKSSGAKSQSSLPKFRSNGIYPINPDSLNGLEIGLIVALIFVSLILIFGGGWAYQKINKRKK